MTQYFSSEPERTSRVEVSWASRFSSMTVELDGLRIGEFKDFADAKRGATFQGPDGSSFGVTYKGLRGVAVSKDGVPLQREGSLTSKPSNPRRSLMLFASYLTTIAVVNIYSAVQLEGIARVLSVAGVAVAACLAALVFRTPVMACRVAIIFGVTGVVASFVVVSYLSVNVFPMLILVVAASKSLETAKYYHWSRPPSQSDIR